jgi:WD40 repeat protein
MDKHSKTISSFLSVKVFRLSWQQHRVGIVIAIAALVGGGAGWWWVQSRQSPKSPTTSINNSINNYGVPNQANLSQSSSSPQTSFLPKPPSIPAPKFQLEQTFTGTGNSTNSLAITPDGETLIVGSDYTKASLWDLTRICLAEECRTPKQVLPMSSLWIYAVAVSGDGELAVGSSWEVVKVWELKTGRLLQDIKTHFGSVYALILSPKKNILVTGSSDQTVKVWDLLTTEMKQTFTGHNSSVQSLAINPEESLVASGAKDGKIKIWSLDGSCPPIGCKTPLLRLNSHKKQINALAITPNGRYVISASADQTVKIWELSTGNLVYSLNSHAGSVLAIAISPDGNFFATGGADHQIKLWEVSTGALLDTISHHNGAVHSLVFSPDGKLLVSGGNSVATQPQSDRQVNVWRRVF